jgi:osmoprotectant transport system permease protein
VTAMLPAVNGEPLVRLNWIGSHIGYLASMSGHHLYLALLPVLLGLIIAIPVGIACVRWGWIYPAVLTGANIFYAIPSLALFMVLIPYTGIGTGSLEDFTVIIPLTLFTLSVLVPNVVDGMRSVPENVRLAATAMGFRPLRRLLQVELPIAVPVVIAGTRVATVASISLASVGILVGNGGLGYLFEDGQAREFTTEIVAGIAIIVVMALLADLVLFVAQRLLTPWARGRAS